MARRDRPARPPTRWRRVDGVLLLDKPAGMSSNQALQRARHVFRAEKGGHTGALDPLATGLLPLCFGEATKIAGELLGADKAYRTVARLGVVTDSDDADGTVIDTRPVPALAPADIEVLLPRFTGRILQRPPVYSALKRDGEPLYARARRGERIEVAEREVEVRAIRVVALEGDRLTLEIECGSGTYVRSLVRDLGAALGCGAHVECLRRLRVAPFHAPRMVTMDALAHAAAEGDAALDALLLPLAEALPDWPRLELDADQAMRLRQGQQIPVDARPGRALAMAPDGRALGLVEVGRDARVVIRRLFAASPGAPDPQEADGRHNGAA